MLSHLLREAHPRERERGELVHDGDRDVRLEVRRPAAAVVDVDVVRVVRSVRSVAAAAAAAARAGARAEPSPSESEPAPPRDDDDDDDDDDDAIVPVSKFLRSLCRDLFG